MLILLTRDGYLQDSEIATLISELEEESKMILAFRRRLKS